ncbi:hypothetical protein ACFLUJ_04140 [Chloroflexota bacterium]
MKRARITEELAYGNALDRLTGIEKPAVVPEKAQPTEETKPTTIKLSVFLNRDEDTYLEYLSSTAKFSGGKKLSKTKLIETMVKAFNTTGLDVRGVKTGEELLQRVIAQLRK